MMSVVVCVGLFAACLKEPQSHHKKIPPRTHKAPKPEVIVPSTPSDENAKGPKRQASERLVEKGVVALSHDDVATAAEHFQSAMNIDSSNGVAYFYMAKVKVAGGNPDEALGFIDRAEQLVGHDSYWQERIDELRTEITGEEPTKDGRPFIDRTY